MFAPRDLHDTFAPGDDVPWDLRRDECMSFLRRLCLPGVNYARNPSKDPEEDIDAEILLKHLSDRSGDVIRRGSTHQLWDRVLAEMCEREIRYMWGSSY